MMDQDFYLQTNADEGVDGDKDTISQEARHETRPSRKLDKEMFSFFSREPSLGPALSVSAFFLLAFYLLITYLPETKWIFEKTSLIGFSVISIFFYLLIFLIPVVLFVYVQKVPDHKILGTNPGVGVFLLSALAGIPFAVLLTSLQNFFVYFVISNDITLPLPPFQFHTTDISAEAQSLQIIVSVLIPIFLEEFLFRGFFFSVFPEKSFPVPKILLSAFLFAAFSLRPETIVTTFILGLLLGFIRQSSGNALCSVLTRLSMAASLYFFSDLLPVLLLSDIRGKAEFDRTYLYTSVVAFTICFIVSIPVLSQLYVSGREILRLRNEMDPESDVPFFKSLGVFPFFIGILLVSCTWVLILGV